MVSVIGSKTYADGRGCVCACVCVYVWKGQSKSLNSSRLLYKTELQQLVTDDITIISVGVPTS